MEKQLRQYKAKVASSRKRLEAFGKTLKHGVSKTYMTYLKKESKENRMIEKYL